MFMVVKSAAFRLLIKLSLGALAKFLTTTTKKNEIRLIKVNIDSFHCVRHYDSRNQLTKFKHTQIESPTLYNFTKFAAP